MPQVGGGAELGVGCQHGHAVAGDVDFGHHGHMTLGGIVDDVLHLLLGVVGLVGHVVIHTGKETLDFASAVGAPGRELGVALELDAPALVVGEVPVKHVHLVQCQPVDVFLDIGHREEVAHHVEQHAAVAEAGSVVDAPGRNVWDEAGPGGQQLQERCCRLARCSPRGDRCRQC